VKWKQHRSGRRTLPGNVILASGKDLVDVKQGVHIYYKGTCFTMERPPSRPLFRFLKGLPPARIRGRLRCGVGFAFSESNVERSHAERRVGREIYGISNRNDESLQLIYLFVTGRNQFQRSTQALARGVPAVRKRGGHCGSRGRRKSHWVNENFSD
jgi:hypothetical protein